MNTLLFGIIPGPDLKSAERLLSEEKTHVDGLELRLDHFDAIDQAALQNFIRTCGLPVMLTVRRNDQGGAFLGTEEERLALLESLCALEPAYVDLEYDVPADFRKKLFTAYPKVQFLSSYHDFKEAPQDLDALYEKIKTPYAHIYKLAVTAQSALDALRMLRFVYSRTDKEKWIGVAMGEEGKASRILAPVAGTCLTYAMLSPESGSAFGQLTAREMQEIYRFRTLSTQTAIYAVIGDPIEKSLGHLIHNAVFANANLNAVYVKLHIKPEEIPGFFTQIADLPLQGISVTMPHKLAILPFLFQKSIPVLVIGACNTLFKQEGKWVGSNTDGIGALNAIERRGKVFGKHMVIIGAGGAAKALIFEAAQRGAYVTVINRTLAKAVEIAQAVGGTGGGFDELAVICEKGYDILVSCIPESGIIDEKYILPGKIVMDIVYTPKNTPFLVKAANKKCHIVFGYEMFAGQALEQLRLWFPKGIDFEKAHAVIEEKLLSALES